MKKLLIIVNTDYAVMSHRIDIALAAMKKGYEVHVACSISSADSPLYNYGFTLHDISLERSGINIFNEIKLFFQIVNLLKNVAPDVVHLVTIKPIFYGGLAVKLFYNTSVLYAVTGLGYVFTSRQIKARLIRLIVQPVYKFVFSHNRSVLILQNRDDIQYLSDRLGIKEKNIVYIPGAGAALEKYCYNDEPDGMTILMASRLLRDKGVYEYIRASDIVGKNNKNVKFILAGGFDFDNPESIDEGELNSLLSKSVVEYIGFSSNIDSELRNCNIAVLPSYREGAPRFLIEAAACGRASVTTYSPGCSDIVSNFTTGLLVPVRDAHSLAVAIEFLISNEMIRRTMGKNARLMAEELFSLESVIDNHLLLYDRLVSMEIH